MALLFELRLLLFWSGDACVSRILVRMIPASNVVEISPEIKEHTGNLFTCCIQIFKQVFIVCLRWPDVE